MPSRKKAPHPSPGPIPALHLTLIDACVEAHTAIKAAGERGEKWVYHPFTEVLMGFFHHILAVPVEKEE